jgi:hypothetical protein
MAAVADKTIIAEVTVDTVIHRNTYRVQGITPPTRATTSPRAEG